jgi:hypothetical protein
LFINAVVKSEQADEEVDNAIKAGDEQVNG